METQEIVKVVSGTTATISFDCVFADGEKKTVNIGSFRAQDIPSDLATRVNNFNANPATGFATTFISAKSGAQFQAINGAEITVKAVNVII